LAESGNDVVKSGHGIMESAPQVENRGYTDGVYYCWISYGVDAQIPVPSKPESITD